VPVCKLTVVSSFVCEGASSFTMSCHLFSRAHWKTRLLALWLPALGSAWGPTRSSCCFMPQFIILLPNALPSPLWTWFLCTVKQLFDGGGKLLQEFINVLVPVCSWLWYPMASCCSPNQSSVAREVSSYVTPLGAPCRTLEAWSCGAVSIIKTPMSSLVTAW
jgi:hypothetical protein